MALSVCIPTYNRLPHFKKFIDSFRKGIGSYPYEIIVADGGSTDGTIEYLKKQKDVKLIEQGKLTGSIKAFNTCFKQAKYEFIFWPSDDFIVNAEELIKCCNLMEKYPEIGMISPKLVETKRFNYPNIGTWKHKLVLSKTHVFRTSVLKEIGFLNEEFRTYYIDVDSHLAVLDKGYVTMFTKGIGVYHTRIEDETRESNVFSNELVKKEEEFYNKKWKYLDAGLSTSSFKIKKAFLFWSLHNKLRDSRIFQSLMKREQPFATNLFDWILQRCLIFEAVEYRGLKGFYLAQKIPKIKRNNKT